MYSLQKSKTLGKNGMINLPKKWLEELGFYYGELVEVRLQKKEIWISHFEEDTKENLRYISAQQNVSIPSEIRNLLNIRKGTKLSLFVEPEARSFVLIPVDED